MKRTKVLVIGTDDTLGGAARIGWDVANSVKKYGFDSKFIVASKNSKSANVYELNKNRLLSTIESKTRFNLVSFFRFFRSFVLANDIDFGAKKEILEHPWYKEADIIHVHNLHGDYFKLETLAKIATEKQTIWTLHDAWALTAHCSQCINCKNYNKGNHFTPGFKGYGPMLWDNADYLWSKKKKIYESSPKLNIVVPSVWLADRVSKSILKTKSLTIINNGIDAKIFRPHDRNKMRKELSLPKDAIIIAYVAQMGTLDARKGGDYFLETAKYFLDNPNVFFLCIGGVIGNKLIRKDNIIYTPYISDKNTLSHYYSSANMLLVVSLAESFSLVVAEAMASGLPVVSFDVGGVREQVVHKENGYIAKYKNEEDVINGIKYVLSLQKSKLESMIKNNRIKAVKNFSLETMTRGYINLYRKVARKNK